MRKISDNSNAPSLQLARLCCSSKELIWERCAWSCTGRPVGVSTRWQIQFSRGSSRLECKTWLSFYWDHQRAVCLLFVPRRERKICNRIPSWNRTMHEDGSVHQNKFSAKFLLFWGRSKSYLLGSRWLTYIHLLNLSCRCRNQIYTRQHQEGDREQEWGHCSQVSPRDFWES